ncbi:brain protein I3-like [Portunus trituberculatus]|uniref:brain protein I3-like n=1 Tax=Portunus trituberculatus TaxID=210409 RepID=UPI001E1CDA0B|nr:brain protein I3-like [Portunus trituberculatus]
MEDAPPPYTSTPTQPPPYKQKADGEVPPVGFDVPQEGTEHIAGAALVPPQPVATHVVVVQQQGSCPICKMGYVREEFTLCGMFMAIMFFPLGLICCLLMRVRRCSHCRAIVI